MNHYFPAFSGGEISPQMLGRSDTEIYRTSAQTIDNFIVQIQGGAMRRAGFKYIADAKAATTTKLIPFYHSSGSEYILEFSNLKFRIFKDGAVVGGPTEVTTVFTTAQIPYLDYAQSGDNMYVTHEDHPPQSITRTSDTAWNIADVEYECAPMFPIDDDTYGRTEDLGNTTITVSTLSANTLGATATLTMSGALFSADDVGKFVRVKNFTADPVAEANASTTTTQTTANVTTTSGASVTVDTLNGVASASIPTVTTRLPAVTTSTRTTPYSTIVSTTSRTYAGAPATGAGGIINTLNGVSAYMTAYGNGSVITTESVTVTGHETESWGLLEITAYSSPTSVTVKVKRPLSSTTFHSTQQWQMSRFGTNTGYPKHVTFHEGRCFFGNTGAGYTNVMVGSKTNSITDFENGEGDEGTLTAATALDYILSEVEAIQWLQPSQRLVIGSSNGVFSISGTGDTGINPLQAPLFRKITSSRCSTVKPIFLQGTTFFTHESSKKLGGIIFKRGEFSGFDFEDMTKFSGHLALDGIKEMAVSGDIVWILDNSGALKGVTYNEETKLIAWHKHSSTDTYNSIQSVESDLYTAITRTNGQYIEIMSDSIQELEKENVICVDSALTYDSVPATIITGLSHLEGETVDILADGASHPTKVVSGGQITLNAAASVVQVGLPYTSTLKTNEVVGGNRRGSSEARVSRIHEIGIKFLASNGAIVQAGDSPLLGVTFNVNQIYGSGPDLFTGTKVQALNSGNTLNPTVTVTSSGALPISILGISADINISEA